MTFTTISSTARRSLLGAVVALVLAVAFLAFASSAKAATASPIGKLDNAGGFWDGVVSGWAADPDVPLYSPIDVRLDVYRLDRVCWPTPKGASKCFDYPVLVDSQTQTAYEWSSEAMWALGGFAGAHGFRFALSPYDYWNRYEACVTALNVGPGSDTSLGCVTLVWIG